MFVAFFVNEITTATTVRAILLGVPLQREFGGTVKGWVIVPNELSQSGHFGRKFIKSCRRLVRANTVVPVEVI